MLKGVQDPVGRVLVAKVVLVVLVVLMVVAMVVLVVLVERTLLEGLPPNLRGVTSDDTIKNLATAVQGYRKRDSDNGVPDDLTAYSKFAEDTPEAIKGNLEALADDKLFSRVAEKAKNLGIGVAPMQALTGELMLAASDAGLLEAPVDVEAERQALVPETAQHLPKAEQQQAIELRMNENFAYLDQMAARDKGGIEKDTADYVKTMLGDSAHGHKFIEFMRSSSGGGSGPTDKPGQGGAGMTKEGLQQRSGLPQNTAGHRDFNKQSYDQLMTDFQNHHGNS